MHVFQFKSCLGPDKFSLFLHIVKVEGNDLGEHLDAAQVSSE